MSIFIILPNREFFSSLCNLLSEIIIISKDISQILINRAAVISNIIEKYEDIHSQVYLNKDKKIEFCLKKNKNKMLLTLDSTSWLSCKINKMHTDGVLLNRREIIGILNEFNGDCKKWQDIPKRKNNL